MASASTINDWIDQLTSSILPKSKVRAKQLSRKPVDSFKRRLRHHHYARTNQFDVDDRLNGLEEKFQVLNRDDLSDALYDRRIELRDHFQQWIPDILDLLLRLSDNPVHKTPTTNLDDVEHAGETPTHLTWAEIEAADPVDPHDPVWKVPVFSDFSSDEDEAETATASGSPTSSRHHERNPQPSDDQQYAKAFVSGSMHSSQSLFGCQLLPDTDDSRILTELQVIRQCLVMAQGLPSTVFRWEGNRLYLDHRVQSRGMPNEVLQMLLKPLHNARENHCLVEEWASQDFEQDYMQRIGQNVQKILRKTTVNTCDIEERVLHPDSTQSLSLISIIDQLEEIGRPLAVVADWVKLIAHAHLDSLSSLEALHQTVCENYFSGNDAGTKVSLSLFLEALFVYLRPVQEWVANGVLQSQLSPFFVKATDDACTLSSMWNKYFELRKDGPYRIPSFLKSFEQDVFACGKTIAFTNHISEATTTFPSQESTLILTEDDLKSLAADPIMPFPVALPVFLSELFSKVLSSATRTLKTLLETRCGFTRTFDAFEFIYLHKDGVILDTIESRIFSRIDKCMEDWNDRFLIADMLEDVYRDVKCIDLDSIIVQSARTSSRSMESRRRSVRILGALAMDYAVPWPVANIIPRASLLAYRRIALHLSQLRRTKHILERTAYTHVNSSVISTDPRDQTIAQVTTFMLIQFTNTLYDHFTTGVILPMTCTMRSDLHAAATVDEMIAVHQTYIANLEFACLTSKPLKVFRETFIGLLDMCIRFADLVSTATASNHGRLLRRDSDDFETSSFMSAQSHHDGARDRERNPDRPRARARARDTDDRSFDSDDDNDDDFTDEGEGYSSFIVLDEDTTVAQEIRKLQVQFRRQLDFFVAGLRGIARGGSAGEEFEVLAGRLDWKSKRS